MSAQTFALLGVVVGALLAGGGDLLLAWRRETIEARAGVHVIRSILEDARDEIGRLMGKKDPRWNPERLPDSRAWDVYRSAVSARLPLPILQKIDKAMRRLDSLNAAAARAYARADQLEGHVWQAAEKDDKETVEKLIKQRSPARLTDSAKQALPSAKADVEAAFDALRRYAPVRAAKQRGWFGSLIPWSRWHWRSLAVAASVLLIGSVAIGIATSSNSETAEVEDALAAHLHDPEMTACEPVEEHEDRFSCVVVEATDGPACQADAEVAASGSLSASIAGIPVNGDSACSAVDLALEYSAIRQSDDDCTSFLETAAAEVPPISEQKKPGFLARLKAKLNEGGAPEADVPPVIVPDTAFMSGC
jgi:hypothetical protein